MGCRDEIGSVGVDAESILPKRKQKEKAVAQVPSLCRASGVGCGGCGGVEGVEGVGWVPIPST